MYPPPTQVAEIEGEIEEIIHVVRMFFFFIKNVLPWQPIRFKELLLTCHGEDTDEEANVATCQHDFFLRFGACAFLLGRPYSHDENEQVKDDDADDTCDVDVHLDVPVMQSPVSRK